MKKNWIGKLIPTRLKELLKNALREILFEELKQFFQKDEPLMKSSQLIRELGISAKTLYNWRRKKLIPYYKISGCLYFKKNEILESIKIRKEVSCEL